MAATYRISPKFQHLTLEEAFGTVITEALAFTQRQERQLNPHKLPALLTEVLVEIKVSKPATDGA